LSYEIVEHFFTVSGEAPLSGLPIYLVRFSGCNLSCAYCDTGYHAQALEVISHDELLNMIQEAIAEYPGAAVLFTGGEPLERGRTPGLVNCALRFPETVFLVETNGSIPLPDVLPENMRFVLDWKMPSSGHAGTFAVRNIPRLRHDKDCIKIVVARDDLPLLQGILAAIRHDNSRVPVFLSPVEGRIRLDELAEYIVSNRLAVSLSLQMHKIIWGNRRGV
jgi:7-carboxy-7-deazaguanine synthase